MEMEEELLIEKTAQILDTVEKNAGRDKQNAVLLTREQLLRVLTEGHHAYFKEIVKQLETKVSALVASRDEWMETAADLRCQVEKLQRDLNQKWVCSACGNTEPKIVSDTGDQSKSSCSNGNKAALSGDESGAVIDLTDEDTINRNGLHKTSQGHPALPPPAPNSQWAPANAKEIPPKPTLKCTLKENGISLNWNATLTEKHEEIAFFQLYSYQQSNAPPSTALWKKIGNVKALPLPMACTLSQFQQGNKYYFAVRAMDVHHRVGAFSNPACVNP